MAENWPTWRRSSGYAELVRYVNVDSLSGLSLMYPHAERSRISARRGGATSPEGANRKTVEHLYDNLFGRFSFTNEPFARVGQRIRDALWLDRGAGTCIDFALVFAAMCVEARIPSLLAVTTPRDPGAVGHAFIVVDLAQDWDDPYQLPPFTEPMRGGEDGEYVVPVDQRMDALDAFGGRFLIIDPSAGNDLDLASFEEAIEAGAHAFQNDADLVLVDVHRLLERPDMTSYDPPDPNQESISRLLPAFPHFEDYRSRKYVLDALDAARGTVALLAAQGFGKSMLAHQRALTADDGCGWFLAATDEETLITSLATAMGRQLGLSVDDADIATRKELASTAKSLLESAQGPWVVVIDNANANPGTLVEYLPASNPDRGHLVIITTTNVDWTREGRVDTVIMLDPLTDDDLKGRLGSGPLLTLVGGRPLLLDSFARLRKMVGPDAVDSAAADPGYDQQDESAGPRLLWAIARNGLSASAVRSAHESAWLPPDNIPVEALPTTVEQRVGDVLEELADHGLINILGSGDGASPDASSRFSIHRLYADAIRAHLTTLDGEPASTLLRIAQRRAALELLDDSGDLATNELIVNALLATYREGPAGGEVAGALREVARIQELHGRITESAATYDIVATRLLAEHPDLSGLDDSDADVLADCLHGRARPNYHGHADGDGEHQLRLALDDIDLALRVRDEHNQVEQRIRTEAFRGLVMRAMAKYQSDVEALATMREAMEIIERSADQRRELLGDRDPETARSIFNIGGGRVTLAQRDDAAEAAAHLDKAHRAYSESLEIRSNIYHRGVHPHIAASVNGLALTRYYEAMLLPGLDATKRLALLREATDQATLALADRSTLDGDADLRDALKSGALLAKILLSRQALAKGEEKYREMLADIDGEIGAFFVAAPS